VRLDHRALVLPLGVLATLALLACSGLLPVGVALITVISLPAAHAHMRQGVMAGGGVVLLTAGTLVLVTGPQGALEYLALFGLLSFLLPLFLRRGMAWDHAAGFTTAILVVIGGLVLASLHFGAGVDVQQAVRSYVDIQMQQTQALMQKGNADAEKAVLIENLIRQVGEFFQRTWPAVTSIGFAGLSLVTLFGLNLLGRGKYPLPGKPFHLWKLPEALIWVLIASGAGMVLAKGIVETAACNVLLVVLAAYFLQGLSILNHFFKKNGVPPVLRTLGYVLVVTLNPLPVIVTGMGVFDMWVDFRKPRKNKD